MSDRTDVVEIKIPSEVCQNIKQITNISETLRIKMQNYVVDNMGVKEEDPTISKTPPKTPSKDTPLPIADKRIKLNQPGNTIIHAEPKRKKTVTARKRERDEKTAHLSDIIEDRSRNNVPTTADEIMQLADNRYNTVSPIIRQLKASVGKRGKQLKKITPVGKTAYLSIPFA